MVATTQMTINTGWVKVSDGNCIIQSMSYDNFQISVGDETPTTDAAITIRLVEPQNFGLDTAVWCRLTSAYTGSSGVVLNVIK